MASGALWVLALALLALPAAAVTAVAGSGGSGYVCVRGVYVVSPDGLVEANLTMEPSVAPANLSVAISTPSPLTVYAVDEGGTPLPVRVEDGVVAVAVYAQAPFTLYYAAIDLTGKENATWTLSIRDGCREAVVALPDEAVPFHVEPENFTVTYLDGRLALAFNSGNVTVKYILAPQPRGTPGTPAPQPQGGTPEEGGEGGGALLAPILAALAAVAAAVAALARRRRGPGGGGVEPRVEAGGLDERDRAILEALRSGPKTAAEIAEATGIPKTPLYRRLRRLTEWGLVEAYQEGGVRRYRLRGRG